MAHARRFLLLAPTAALCLSLAAASGSEFFSVNENEKRRRNLVTR